MCGYFKEQFSSNFEKGKHSINSDHGWHLFPFIQIKKSGPFLVEEKEKSWGHIHKTF